MSRDLSYRLDIARRSLASTTRPDGGIDLTRDTVIELMELLEVAGSAATELVHLRQSLLDLLNDPTHRTVTIPIREVAVLLQRR